MLKGLSFVKVIAESYLNKWWVQVTVICRIYRLVCEVYKDCVRSTSVCYIVVKGLSFVKVTAQSYPNKQWIETTIMCGMYRVKCEVCIQCCVFHYSIHQSALAS